MHKCMSLFENSSTMKTMQMLEMGLGAAATRRQVLANNIANVDVPHFKRSEVAFEMELKRAVESKKKELQDPAIQTLHPSHISGRKGRDYRTVNPSVITDYNSSMRNDGNNVDIEDEVTKLNRNQMHFNLMVDQIGGKLRLLNSLIRLS